MISTSEHITNEQAAQVPTITLTTDEVAVLLMERQLEQAKRDNIITSYSLNSYGKSDGHREFYGYMVHWDGECRAAKTHATRHEAVIEACAIVTGLIAKRALREQTGEYDEVTVTIPSGVHCDTCGMDFPLIRDAGSCPRCGGLVERNAVAGAETAPHEFTGYADEGEA